MNNAALKSNIFLEFFRHFKAYQFRKGDFYYIGNYKGNYAGGKHCENAHTVTFAYEEEKPCRAQRIIAYHGN